MAAESNELKALSLVKSIKQCHEEGKKNFTNFVGWAIKCGELLCEAKAHLGHPSFGGYVEQYFEFSHQTANVYMKLHNDLGGLSNSQRARILNSADSLRGLQKLLPAPAKKQPDESTQEHRVAASERGGGTAKETPQPPPNTDPFEESNWANTEEYTTPRKDPGEEPPATDKPPEPGITAKTGREAEVWEAQQVLKQWSDAVGRWMNGNPAGIDVYREQFPGPLGDRVIDAAKELFNAMVAWKKGLK